MLNILKIANVRELPQSVKQDRLRSRN